jgi:hypothetical protein
MGAYQAAALALSPHVYYPLDVTEYMNPDTRFITRASVYPAGAENSTFAQVGDLIAGPALMAGEAAGLFFDYVNHDVSSDPHHYDYAGENRNSGATTFGINSYYTFAATTHVITLAREKNYTHNYENGTIYSMSGRSPDNRTAALSLRHLADQPNLQLTIEGYWNDTYEPLGGNWYGLAFKTFDTGISIDALLDSRPHLLAFRVQSFTQAPTTTQQPLPTTAWVEVWIDGALLYTCPLGPGWGSAPTVTGAGFTASAADEWGMWNRHLTVGELGTLWSNWATDAPFKASARATIRTNTAADDGTVLAIGHPEGPEAFISRSWSDHKWITVDKDAGPAIGDGMFRTMGPGTYEGVNPWAPAWENELADKWLTDQDVALGSEPIRGVATASGDLSRAEQQFVGLASGQASASATLSIEIPLEAEPVNGSSVAWAVTLGDLLTLAGSSDGSSDVSGELVVGQIEVLAGASAGSSTATATLSVSVYSLIGGNEVDENGMPMAVDGIRRGRFTPKSSGLANKSVLVGS